jgi:hypothetical protein
MVPTEEARITIHIFDWGIKSLVIPFDAGFIGMLDINVS